MDCIEYSDYMKLVGVEPKYYKDPAKEQQTNRWRYIQPTIDIIEGLNFDSCLELGPHIQTIVKGADTMDNNPDLKDITYRHNACFTPWPIADKQYDLFVALQVFEHLDTDPERYLETGRQKEAFAEVRRISRQAVISFPYMWNNPGNHHHGVDYKRINEWCLNCTPTKTAMVQKWPGKPNGWYICCFDFENVHIEQDYHQSTKPRGAIRIVPNGDGTFQVSREAGDGFAKGL